MIAGVPYDAEIEYLESTGTQYVILPFGFYNTDKVYARFSVDRTETQDKYMVSPVPWTSSANNNRFSMGVHQRLYCGAYGNVSTSGTFLLPVTQNDGAVHSWIYENYAYSIPELNIQKDVSAIEFGETTGRLYLFYGYNAPTKGRYCYYKHIKNSVTIADLIPVRVGTVGYMYDRVTRKLFGNQGTGAFTIGPDVARPVMGVNKYGASRYGIIGARNIIYRGA